MWTKTLSRIDTRKIIILILLISGIAIAVSPQILWGFETIAASDIIRHFIRAKALAHHDVDMFHYYPETRIVDMYPPGGHLLMAAIMQLSSIYSIYSIAAIIKITFMVVILLLYFVIGKKISTEVGLLAMFFRLFMFYVTPNVGAKYIFFMADQIHFTAWNITELFVLLSILALYYLLFESNLTKKRFLVWDLILLFSVVFHGLTHISTFIGYFVSVPLFLTVLAIIYAPLKSLRKAMLTRITHVVSILGISVCCAYVIYYKKLTDLVLAEGYDISMYLPSWFPQHFIYNHLPFVIAIGIGCCINIILSYKHIAKSQIKKIELPDGGLKFLLISYVISYICTICATNMSSKYMRIVAEGTTTYNIGAFYPIFFTISSNPITMLTQVGGIGLFLLSVFGLINLIKSENSNSRYIALFYTSSYIAWFLFFIPIPYYSHRIGIFRFFIPFLFAASVIFIYQYAFKLQVIFKEFAKTHKSPVIFKKSHNLGTFLVIALLLLFIVINGMSVINKDPAIRMPGAFSSPFRIGTLSPPLCTPEFLDRVNAWTEPDEVVLSTPQTSQCLAAVTDITPISLRYSLHDPEHSEYDEVMCAILYEGKYMDSFFKKYNARYLVVTIYDSYLSRKFDKNPNLIKIYEDPYGQTIYVYSKP